MREYHLVCLATGTSYGGFETIEGAREYARCEHLAAWGIWRDDVLVERHDPECPVPVQAQVTFAGSDGIGRQHLKKRAEMARVIAESFVYPETRANMLKIAAMYDRLAGDLEEIEPERMRRTG